MTLVFGKRFLEKVYCRSYPSIKCQTEKIYIMYYLMQNVIHLVLEERMWPKVSVLSTSVILQIESILCCFFSVLYRASVWWAWSASERPCGRIWSGTRNTIQGKREAHRAQETTKANIYQVRFFGKVWFTFTSRDLSLIDYVKYKEFVTFWGDFYWTQL